MIETERLNIRYLKKSDRQNMQDILVDFENSPSRIYDYPMPAEPEKIKFLINSWMKNFYFFVIELKNSREVAGFVCFGKGSEYTDIGYNLKQKYWRQGYGTEMLTATIKYMHEEKGVAVFTANCAEKNTASASLLKKLGFVYDFSEKVSFRDGEISICDYYILEIK